MSDVPDFLAYYQRKGPPCSYQADLSGNLKLQIDPSGIQKPEIVCDDSSIVLL